MATAAAVKTRNSAQTKGSPQRKVAVYRWSGKTKGGDVRSGEMEATEPGAVEARLRQMGIEPVKVRKKPKELHINIPGMGGVTTKDLVVFTRQFSVMIDAGLPLVQALDIIGTQADNLEFRRVLLAVKGKVEAGATFADSLAEFPKVFDELFVQLIRAGEVGGILDTILQRLGAYMEKNEKLKRRVQGAMTYPSIVLTISFAVVGVLIGKVVPTFEKMFKDMGGALPGPTQFLVDVSHGFVNSWYLYLGAPIVLVVAFKLATNKGRGQEIWHAMLLKMPVFGPLVQKTSVARFTRTLGTMLSSGVPILDALDIVARSAGNKVIEKAVLYVRAKISEGKTIAAPLADSKVFPAMVVQMIGVGEATGAMDTMLNKIADFYDDEVDVAVASITSLIEPIMMVFLGGVVGFFMIAMYLPIFTMANNVR